MGGAYTKCDAVDSFYCTRGAGEENGSAAVLFLPYMKNINVNIINTHKICLFSSNADCKPSQI